jgi:LysM repeat protein
VKIHIIQHGETLEEIAQVYGVELERILEVNPAIEHTQGLEVGKKLRIPSQGVKVIIQSKSLHKYDDLLSHSQETYEAKEEQYVEQLQESALKQQQEWMHSGQWIGNQADLPNWQANENQYYGIPDPNSTQPATSYYDNTYPYATPVQGMMHTYPLQYPNDLTYGHQYDPWANVEYGQSWGYQLGYHPYHYQKPKCPKGYFRLDRWAEEWEKEHGEDG